MLLFVSFTYVLLFNPINANADSLPDIDLYKTASVSTLFGPGYVDYIYTITNNGSVDVVVYLFDDQYSATVPLFGIGDIGILQVGNSWQDTWNVFLSETTTNIALAVGTDDQGVVVRVEDAFTVTVEPIPEPTTMLLLGTGLVGVAGAARRRKKNQA